ncbi:MAG: hypothetical protein KAX40_05640 [Herpetosiphon sp.]|nr:hypothetical protein [Herpetosiphon sp.]
MIVVGLNLIWTIALGWLLVAPLFRVKAGWISTSLILSMAFLSGQALISLIFFVVAVIYQPSVLVSGMIELLLAIGLAWRMRRTSRQSKRSITISAARLPMLTFAVIGAMLVSLVIMVWNSVLQPLGGWDAWAFWNTRSLFMVRGGDAWQTVFQLRAVFHTDYPWLLSSVVARGWLLAGETAWLTSAFSIMFAWCSVGLLFGGLALLRSQFQALLAVLALLGTYWFTIEGYGQVSDLPLAGYLLMAFVVIELIERGMIHELGYGLVGFAIGAAAWTKNEGIVLAVLAMLVLIIALWRKRHTSALMWLVVGIMPFVLVVGYFKIVLAPPVDLIEAQQASPLAKLLDPSRYITIAKFYAVRFFSFARGILPLLMLYAVLVGVQTKRWRSVIVPVLIVGLLQLSYIGVYLLTPFSLQWHLETSQYRLWLHTLPAAIFTLFFILNEPQFRSAPVAEIEQQP